MNILDMLFANGVPSYTLTIYTPIPASAPASFPIGGNLPEVIGRVFGMAIYSDGVTPDGSDLLTTQNCFDMYISYKIGTNDFIEEHRLSDFVTFVAGVPTTTKPDPYTRVHIPNGIDLTKSKYINPTLIAPGGNQKTIALKLWYITPAADLFLQKRGILIDESNYSADLKAK